MFIYERNDVHMETSVNSTKEIILTLSILLFNADLGKYKQITQNIAPSLLNKSLTHAGFMRVQFLNFNSSAANIANDRSLKCT